jgi:hypothetical protein
MENTKEYSIKRLDASMLKDLEDLHTLVYGSRPGPQHFPRKYDTAYTGIGYVGFMAYHTDGEPLAYYGVLPCFMQYKGGIVLAAQSADTMTNPKYRYKGLFVELSLITFSLCRSLGIKFVFGFPNQNSYHGAVNKLGWKMTHTMERFYVPVESMPLEGAANRFSWLKPLYSRYVDRVLGQYTLAQPGLGNAFAGEGLGGICRDESYLLYRSYSPSRVIRIGAARVWIRVKGGLVIGDLQTEGADFAATIDNLRKLARRAGLAGISFIVSPGTAVHRQFAAAYTPEASFPVLFQDLGSPIPFEDIRFSYSDIDIF